MLLEELRNRHDGETVWVFGSGPSLNFLDPKFFEDKITISTNTAAKAFGVKPDYVFSHYHHVAHSLLNDVGTVVTIELDTKSYQPWSSEKPDSLVIAKTPHEHPQGSSWNPFTRHTPKENEIVYGSSSLHGAMHLGAHLGANFIVLVGADCGYIDSTDNLQGYNKGHPYPHRLYNEHHKLMKEWLVREYGVTVYSLNPFVNLNLEGHKFEGV